MIVQEIERFAIGEVCSTPERISKSPVKPTLGELSPGDLSFVLAFPVFLQDIQEMLLTLDKFIPVLTLLYNLFIWSRGLNFTLLE